MNDAIRKSVAPILFVANLIVIFWIWYDGTWSLISFGRLFGLVAFYLVLWQLLLIGRIGWIEKYWGHDVLSRVHRRNGVVAIMLIGLHPVFIILGYSGQSGVTPIDQFWNVLTVYEFVIPAFVAYIMFLSIVFVSLEMVRRKLRYEYWYYIHVLLYGAIILSFGHQLALGNDLTSDSVRYYWQILFFGTFALVLFYRFLKPAWISWRQDFRVIKIERETDDVVSVYFSGNIYVKPGQFVLVRFFARGFWWESHPFTISGLPMRITVKAVGDFTSKLEKVPIGTRVFIEGPLGRFIFERSGSSKVLLIAGGIGITPLRMLFERFSNAKRDIKLIYAARSNNDFALKNELDRIGSVSYTTDLLTSDFIKNTIPDVDGRFVYICGPPAMMKAVIGCLKKLGVPKHRILYEKFQLG